jgi:hypothetical protein
MTSFAVPLVCALLLLAVLAAVVQPVLTRRHAWRRATGVNRRRVELTERKEQLYASLKELEFDHSLGKMTEEDYEAVRHGLEADAVTVLRDLDALEQAGDASAATPATPVGDAAHERIEADIARRRSVQAPVAQAPASAPAPASQPASGATPHAFCHACGQRRTPEHRFCPHCGQSFAAAS